MPRAAEDQVLIIACDLCGSNFPTLRGVAWYDAIDHGLDVHRVQLLATPENARRFFRIVNPVSGRQVRTIKKLGSV